MTHQASNLLEELLLIRFDIYVVLHIFKLKTKKQTLLWPGALINSSTPNYGLEYESIYIPWGNGVEMEWDWKKNWGKKSWDWFE